MANLSDCATAQVMKVVLKSIPEKDSCQFLDFSKSNFNLSLKIPGSYNISNAKAAFQVGLILGIDPQTIKSSLESYTGVGRRFEYIGDYKGPARNALPEAAASLQAGSHSDAGGAKVYSDFGHHPTEVRETLKALREKYPDNRILVIYQPHMFTRTKYLFDDFVKVFQNAPADKIFIMDIYQSREKDLGLVTSKQLVTAVNKPSVIYIGSIDKTLEKLKPEIQNGDIVFFMSAGDIDYLAKKLVSS